MLRTDDRQPDVLLGHVLEDFLVWHAVTEPLFRLDAVFPGRFGDFGHRLTTGRLECVLQTFDLADVLVAGIGAVGLGVDDVADVQFRVVSLWSVDRVVDARTHIGRQSSATYIVHSEPSIADKRASDASSRPPQ